jgi:signal transduction histidine kinase
MPPYLDQEAINQVFSNIKHTDVADVTPPIELKRQRRNGTSANIQLWTAVLRSDYGEPEGMLAIIADITEQKQLEEQFRHAQKMEAVGRLAGGVAHDFNNLLTVITGYAQLASRRLTPDEPGFPELQEVLAASDRAAGLTKQLLALSRRHVVQPVLLDLNDLIANTERMLRRLMGDPVELVVHRGVDVPPVRADRTQIELVLLNLAANARDALPSGGHVTISTLRLSDGRAALRVVDDGTGMSKETAARAFEPFFTTKEEGKGTGLGLSTSYSIIKQHGGEIVIFSKVNVGTQVEIRLPAARERSASRGRIAKNPANRGIETVLVVEDDDSAARLMRETLAGLGYAILSASAENEAVTLALEFPGRIDLMVADAALRQCDTAALMKRFRKMRPEAGLLLVANPDSASLASEDVEVLQKPLSPETFGGKVRQVLSRRVDQGSATP